MGSVIQIDLFDFEAEAEVSVTIKARIVLANREVFTKEVTVGLPPDLMLPEPGNYQKRQASISKQINLLAGGPVFRRLKKGETYTPSDPSVFIKSGTPYRHNCLAWSPMSRSEVIRELNRKAHCLAINQAAP